LLTITDVSISINLTIGNAQDASSGAGVCVGTSKGTNTISVANIFLSTNVVSGNGSLFVSIVGFVHSDVSASHIVLTVSNYTSEEEIMSFFDQEITVPIHLVQNVFSNYSYNVIGLLTLEEEFVAFTTEDV
jgi:hypothetical protein